MTFPPRETHFLEKGESVRPAWAQTQCVRDQTLEANASPGNVRELQHVLERAVLLSRGGVLRLDGALGEPEETTRAKSSESTPGALQAVIPEIEWRRRERENLRTALQLAKGRIYGPDGAADILGSNQPR